jgi:hypothetical protein
MVLYKNYGFLGFPSKQKTRVYQQLLRSLTNDVNEPTDIKPLHKETRKFTYLLFIQPIIASLGSSIIITTTGNKESMAEWIISHYL